MERKYYPLLLILLAVLAVASIFNSGGDSPYNDLLDKHKRSICHSDPSVDCPPNMEQAPTDGQPSQVYELN